MAIDGYDGDWLHSDELYRLWFEFYKHALAESELEAEIRLSANFYRRWGDVRGRVSFKSWWKTHSSLFQERQVSVILHSGEEIQDDGRIYVAFSTNKSASFLCKEIMPMLKEELKSRRSSGGKHKKNSNAQFRLTPGAEPRIKSIIEALDVYRIYLRHGKPQLDDRFLNAIREYYAKHRRRSIAKGLLSANGQQSDRQRCLRNLQRTVMRAKTLLRNAALGDFPGKGLTF